MQKKTKESPKQQDNLSLKNKHLTIHKELYRQRTCFNARFFLYLCRIFTRTIVIMTKANKVLFITQEITPYVSESEMANIGRHLPQAIQEKGREIRTFMPKWGNIQDARSDTSFRHEPDHRRHRPSTYYQSSFYPVSTYAGLFHR